MIAGSRLAATCAAAASADSFLTAAAAASPDAKFAPHLATTTRVVAEHFARGKPGEQVAPLLKALADGNTAVAESIVAGLVAGWPRSDAPKLSDASIDDLKRLLAQLGSSGRTASDRARRAMEDRR